MNDPEHTDSEATDAYLTQLADGSSVSSQELAAIVYEDLHRMAKALFRRESPDHTLQPTALVHEAYLRLADQKVADGWDNRAQFLAVAATAMRRVLANAARSRQSLKRGGGAERVTLTGNDSVDSPQQIDLIDLEAALEHLAGIKERYVQIVELRYFAGLSIPEIAQVLGVSPTVIDRDWAKAGAYLAVRLQD